MDKTKNNYLIVTIKSWNIQRAHELISNSPHLNIDLITDKKELTFNRLKNLNPRFVFFPHWSWIIPRKIFENFECVIFHMTDLPFGRGGSPLQNLIERGIYETKISALKVVKDLDAGPIYFKRDLTLDGSATEIFCRASDIIFNEMIPEIIKNEPKFTPQRGKTTIFKRRIPEQSDISNLTTSTKVYDYIRMLDAEGYPPAFVETSKLKIEFSKGKLNNGYVSAQAKIKVKNE